MLHAPEGVFVTNVYAKAVQQPDATPIAISMTWAEFGEKYEGWIERVPG